MIDIYNIKKDILNSYQQSKFKILFGCLLVINVIYFGIYIPLTKNTKPPQAYKSYLELFEEEDDLHLINNTGCVIESMNPHSKDIMRFVTQPEKIKCPGEILTYITQEKGNKYYLNVNRSLSGNSLLCCYMTVERDMNASIPDNIVRYSDCVPFVNRIMLKDDEITIRVICVNNYDNVHYIFKKPKTKNYRDRPNVLMIGIDAVSRLNLIRTMPKTVAFCQINGWIDLKGYNKILHNTFPNIMAAMTGIDPKNAGKLCDFNNVTSFGQCDFIWKHFKRLNYTTVYAEDWPLYSTFNWNKVGFLEPPTDYYLRAYLIALDSFVRKEFCQMPQCYGPVNIGQQMVRFIKNFISVTRKQVNSFGFFWMNTFSHSDLNCPRNMDEHFYRLFKYLKRQGVLEDTIVVFFSDHGFRFGRILETNTGWLENRLPFNYIWLPKKFRSRHKEEYLNLLRNTRRLTSPYDLHMTLKHILSLYHPKYKVKPSPGCPTCTSLFRPIKPERNCSEAGIPAYWCTCSKYVPIENDNLVSLQASDFSLKYINRKLEGSNCSKYKMRAILEAKALTGFEEVVNNVVVRVRLEPEATFEVNLQIRFDNHGGVLNFEALNVNRLERYAPKAWCAKKKELEKFCYCL